MPDLKVLQGVLIAEGMITDGEKIGLTPKGTKRASELLENLPAHERLLAMLYCWDLQNASKVWDREWH